ncbi:magnesium transporter [Nematocida major]|uniref:magnesium transporter n=1 Tax=Nematocida major TaxID=1912982 RepID=UPI0020075455|nr:magnesium transporter [Nematocida major]KAH9386247.1 magnesium transporter [Nematocida major]
MNAFYWASFLSFALTASTASPNSCKADADCQVASITGAHSLFCVENQCVQLKPPGTLCSSPSECASYPFFGPLACTDKCLGGFCCRYIPNGAACSENRPAGVNGCTSGFVCSAKETGPVCAPSFSKFWILGPILSVTGNLFINIGLNLQKKSYVTERGVFLGVSVSLFALGIASYILGKISGFTSYVFGNQSLMTSLGAVGLIANSIFAPMINGEVFTIYDFLCIVFVLLGSSLILSNAGSGKREYTLLSLLQNYFEFGTFMWFVFLLMVILSLLILCTVVEENSDWKIGSTAPWVNLDRKFSKNGPCLKYFMLFAYVGMSACIASFTTLFAKSFGLMISLTISGQNQFLGFGPYFFGALIFLCTVGQIYWLNKALKRYDALLVIPVFHILWTLTSITTAGIYFKDFSMFTSTQFNYFILGLVTIFLGSTFLTFRMLGKDSPSTENAQLTIETKQK